MRKISLSIGIVTLLILIFLTGCVGHTRPEPIPCVSKGWVNGASFIRAESRVSIDDASDIDLGYYMENDLPGESERYLEFCKAYCPSKFSPCGSSFATLYGDPNGYQLLRTQGFMEKSLFGGFLVVGLMADSTAYYMTHDNYLVIGGINCVCESDPSIIPNNDNTLSSDHSSYIFVRHKSLVPWFENPTIDLEQIYSGLVYSFEPHNMDFLNPINITYLSDEDMRIFKLNNWTAKSLNCTQTMTGNSITSTIDANGGTIYLEGVSINIPNGALTSPTSLTLKEWNFDCQYDSIYVERGCSPEEGICSDDCNILFTDDGYLPTTEVWTFEEQNSGGYCWNPTVPSFSVGTDASCDDLMSSSNFDGPCAVRGSGWNCPSYERMGRAVVETDCCGYKDYDYCFNSSSSEWHGNPGGSPSDDFDLTHEFFLGRVGDIICGDGMHEGMELCDDGNLIDGDGCSSVCTIEAIPVSVIIPLINDSYSLVIGSTAAPEDNIASIDVSGKFSLGTPVEDSYTSLNENLIVVGGPCVNTIAANLMGNPANCTLGFEQGKGIIKVFNNNNKTQIMIAGMDAIDTRIATKAFVNESLWSLFNSNPVITYGTSLNDVNVE